MWELSISQLNLSKPLYQEINSPSTEKSHNLSFQRIPAQTHQKDEKPMAHEAVSSHIV